MISRENYCLLIKTIKYSSKGFRNQLLDIWISAFRYSGPVHLYTNTKSKMNTNRLQAEEKPQCGAESRNPCGYSSFPCDEYLYF